uniref:Transmembrane protein 223 n=1 Tax=Strigamia maritima TaxID=126957 RepID=T1JGR0_STRMM
MAYSVSIAGFYKRFSRNISRNASFSFAKNKLLPFEVDTRVGKDVTLYQYENTRFHRLLSFFAVGQFFCWGYLSHFAYTCLRDTPISDPDGDIKTKLPFWRRINMGENKYRYGLTVLCASLGYMIVSAAWLFSFRSIHSLVLLRGGEKLRIVTYKPFGLRRNLRVDVDQTACSHSRNDATSFLSLKVKGHYLYFLLDKSGTFTNRRLFDHTAGMKRKFE